MSCEIYRTSMPRFREKPVTYVATDEAIEAARRLHPDGIVIDLRDYPRDKPPSLYADVSFGMGPPEGGLPCFCTSFNERPIDAGSIESGDVLRFALLGAAIVLGHKGVLDIDPNTTGWHPVETVLPADVQQAIAILIIGGEDYRKAL